MGRTPDLAKHAVGKLRKSFLATAVVSAIGGKLPSNLPREDEIEKWKLEAKSVA